MSGDRRFHITGSRTPRPSSGRTIFCDGGRDESYRDETDLELSHWIPNATPAHLDASTSTEIGLEYLEGGSDGGYDLVVNNHVDVDGVLSVYVLLHEELALANRTVLVETAEIGDFWGWGERPAQALFQSLTLLLDELEATETDRQEVYTRAFERVTAILEGAPTPEAEPGLEALSRSVQHLDDGAIERTAVHPRFVHHAIPRELAERDLEAALRVPPFNAPLSSESLLLPQARARLDLEAVQLISVEAPGGAAGWYHDLWFPGYAWAHAPRLWSPPGLVSTGSSNVHHLDHEGLARAARGLAERETGPGDWVLAHQLSPFAGLAHRGFPVVLSFVSGGGPRPSRLPPSTVVDLLAPALAG